MARRPTAPCSWRFPNQAAVGPRRHDPRIDRTHSRLQVGRIELEPGVVMPSSSSQNGFSLVETVIALGVLTVGVLGAAAVLATGMQHLSSSPADVIVTQKAAQAIEAVFSARDSHKLTWAQIRNVQGRGGQRRRRLSRRPAAAARGRPGRPGQHRRTTTARSKRSTLPGKDQTARHGRRPDDHADAIHARDRDPRRRRTRTASCDR